MPLCGQRLYRLLGCAMLLACAGSASALPPIAWRSPNGGQQVSFEQLVDDQTPVNSSGARRLVRNPAAKPGDPPFALADRTGRVVRLVEPTPSVRLTDFVGQEVLIRHDTGRTLLASQLELPLSSTAGIRVAQLPSGSEAEDEASDKSVLSDAINEGNTDSETTPTEPLPEPIILEEIIPEPIEAPLLEAYPNGDHAHRSEALQFPSIVSPVVPCPDCQQEGIQAPLPRSLSRRGKSSHQCARCRSGRLYGPSNCPTCNRGNAGVDFSSDLLFLRAHETTALDSGSGYDSATRWEIGYSGAWRQRLGLRYFEYGTNTRLGGLIDLETLDLVYEQEFPLGCCGEWGLSGGLRWSEYDERTGNFAFGYSNSIGPLLGISLRAPATQWADGFINLRQSFQFGEPYRRNTAVGRGTFAISEFQVGLEHRRKMQIGDGFIRGTFETQYWNGVHTGGTGDLGLIGFGIGVGLQR